MQKYLYLLLAIIGICWTWYWNIQFFQTATDTSLSNFIAQCLTTFPAKSISADISVVCLTCWVFMVYEGLRLNMKIVWLLIPLSLLIAIAFTFPLFMFFRELKLEKIATATYEK